jgi:DNA-binding XRE family transcriptional regulator
MGSTADESPELTKRTALVRLRDGTGLSQEGLAEALQLSRSSIARHERGEGGAPHPDVCLRYAEFYGVTVMEIRALFA